MNVCPYLSLGSSNWYQEFEYATLEDVDDEYDSVQFMS